MRKAGMITIADGASSAVIRKTAAATAEELASQAMTYGRIRCSRPTMRAAIATPMSGTATTKGREISWPKPSNAASMSSSPIAASNAPGRLPPQTARVSRIATGSRK